MCEEAASRLVDASQQAAALMALAAGDLEIAAAEAALVELNTAKAGRAAVAKNALAGLTS